MNKQSNIYTIIYIIVVVVIVSAALSITATALKPKQTANANADKMRQILFSIGVAPQSDDVIATFGKTITEQLLVNSQGEVITRVEAGSDDTTVFDTDVASEINKPAAERRLPVFVAKTDAGVKYIIPVYGAGLWGPIWGYVALDSNGSTIYGAYFSHASETPGLGAEIEKPQFSDQFQGKDLYKAGKFLPVEVVKAGQKPADADADYVNGVSGGTITSKGVGSMLDNCLRPYASFLSTLNKQ